jgi:hypothetical protein
MTGRQNACFLCWVYCKPFIYCTPPIFSIPCSGPVHRARRNKHGKSARIGTAVKLTHSRPAFQRRDRIYGQNGQPGKAGKGSICNSSSNGPGGVDQGMPGQRRPGTRLNIAELLRQQFKNAMFRPRPDGGAQQGVNGSGVSGGCHATSALLLKGDATPTATLGDAVSTTTLARVPWNLPGSFENTAPRLPPHLPLWQAPALVPLPMSVAMPFLERSSDLWAFDAEFSASDGAKSGWMHVHLYPTIN